MYNPHSTVDTRNALRHFARPDDIDAKHFWGWFGVVAGGYHARMKDAPPEASEAYPVFERQFTQADDRGAHPEWRNLERYPSPPDPNHPWQIVKAGDAVRFADDKNTYWVTKIYATSTNQRFVTVFTEDFSKVFDSPCREITAVTPSFLSERNDMQTFGEEDFLIPATRTRGPGGVYYYVNRVTNEGVVVDCEMRHNTDLIGPYVEPWKGVDSDVYYQEVFVPMTIFPGLFKPTKEDAHYRSLIMGPGEPLKEKAEAVSPCHLHKAEMDVDGVLGGSSAVSDRRWRSPAARRAATPRFRNAGRVSARSGAFSMKF